jgi:glycogen debranching enzyme
MRQLELPPNNPSTQTTAKGEDMNDGPARILEIAGSRPWPLGATLHARGTQLALYAPDASRVELCLFDDSGHAELQRLALPSFSNGVWHGSYAGVTDGAVYGYRVHGPWQPRCGHRFNPAKVLLDPYAREIVGSYTGSELCRDSDAADEDRIDIRDNAGVALKARVRADPAPLAESDHVRVETARTVLYEANVRSQTMLHPSIPAQLRGTYAALAHPAMIEHYRSLGVTTLNLLPLMQRVDEPRLLSLGLTNHWGYNTIGWFCSEPRLASGRHGTTAQSECRAMIAELHRAGFEVILDVVFNHTADGDLQGPTLSLRGIGNRAYYHLDADGRYANWSGCGNCLDMSAPRVVQLAMDSMRFWVQQMGVDGFRFDLAPILGRRRDGSFQPDAPLFSALQQDPELSRAKLIAEPWDIGPSGYQSGRFPGGWHEWNDRYRDGVRRYWLRGDVSRGQFVDVFAGSSALFAPSGRDACASINFVTAHDGFTLRDLVSYEHRQNDANGESNRDGHGENHSVNCGIEGDSDSISILRQRRRLQRALLATLIFSKGTPMLLAGDEIGHTQRGNNNAYCQDNCVSWLDWDQGDVAMADFVAACVRLRARHGALGSATWLADGDVTWLGANGLPLREHDWNHATSGFLAVLFTKRNLLDGSSPRPQLLLLFNPTSQAVNFLLPGMGTAGWNIVLDSASGSTDTVAVKWPTVTPRSVLVAEPVSPSSPLQSLQNGRSPSTQFTPC